MKSSIKDFFSKWDQIRSFLQIWPQLPKKSLMENFTFCAASAIYFKFIQNIKDIIIAFTAAASFTLLQIFEIRKQEKNFKF